LISLLILVELEVQRYFSSFP